MYTTYHLPSAQDVNMDILNAIKTAYNSKPITITIEEEIDTTSYLLSTPANRAHLKMAIEQDKANEHILIKHNDL